MNIWSARWSTAKGPYWKKERECSPETQDAWMKIFSEDEPGVTFILSDRKPSMKKHVCIIPRIF